VSASLDRTLFQRKISKGHDISDNPSNKVKIKPTLKSKKSKMDFLSFLGFKRDSSSFLYLSKKSDKDIEAIDSSISRDDKENDEVVHSLWEKDKPSVGTHQERELLEHGYNSEDEFFLLAEQKGTLSGVETVPSSEDRYWASSGIEGKVKLLSQYFNLILSYQIISFSHSFIFP
jgi:hypothetical protein